MTPDGDAQAQALRIEIRGVPRAQPRGRHVAGRVVSTTGPAVRWRRLVREAALAAIEAATADGLVLPLRGPVEFTLAVRFPTPDAQRWGKWRTAIRDRDFDNAMKLAADVAVGCGVLVDDGQVARALYEARWVAPQAAGAVVTVRVLDGAAAQPQGAQTAPEWLGS